MTTLSELAPGIQYAVRRLSDATLTFEKLGQEVGLSKQAIAKQHNRALAYLKNFEKVPAPTESPSCQNCHRLSALVVRLRRQLILNGVTIQGLQFFKEQVHKFFPRFNVCRLPAFEKKQILDWLEKFKRTGGLVKEFAKSIGRSPETLARWQAAYDAEGLSGLTDKTTRPNSFGNKIPLWIKNQLVALFIRFPQWTPYQYHSHIRHNPATHWYVSLPVIKKLKLIHQEKSEIEKERLRKSWCFAKGTSAWTIDFTCIQQTDTYKLQLFTVSDQRSRFLLHTELFLSTSTELVTKSLEDLFIKYGKPDIMKADNGPEFRMEFREHLKTLAIHLLNSPPYYGQFCGAHERSHRRIKTFISTFNSHQSLTILVNQINDAKDQVNYKIPLESLNNKTPAEMFLSGDESFTRKGAEVITPYEKDGELRMKFTGRNGKQSRISIPII
jgi:putative transposase